ncbi:MAG: YicC/YloC family endoribonuclease [Desulfovibrionaceae bacterium]
MIKSMTGFGRSILQETDWTQNWEIRSVNGRYLDIKWRQPLFARGLEARWERVVREYASRGRVDVTLSVQITRPDLLGITFNRAQATAMLAEMERFAQATGRDFAPDLNRLLPISSLWEDGLREPDDTMADSLEQGLRDALADWDASRALEGQALAKDLGLRLIRLGEWLTQLLERTPEVKEEKFESMRGRIEAVLERYAIEPDETRLIQEMAVLSDKLDVSEEMTRLTAHLDQLGSVIDQGRDAGKRLDFLLQECFREINTCGNKAQDAAVSRLVVDFKAELEKCREQVQNVE